MDNVYILTYYECSVLVIVTDNVYILTYIKSEPPKSGMPDPNLYSACWRGLLLSVNGALGLNMSGSTSISPIF